MKAVDIAHAEIGTVSSRQDGSVSFRVLTPELKPNEAGALMGWHGKACRVLLTPLEETPEEIIQVDTEREIKTPCQRLRGVLYIWHRESQSKETFQAFYESKMQLLINHVKKKLPDQ